MYIKAIGDKNELKEIAIPRNLLYQKRSHFTFDVLLTFSSKVKNSTVTPNVLNRCSLRLNEAEM